MRTRPRERAIGVLIALIAVAALATMALGGLSTPAPAGSPGLDTTSPGAVAERTQALASLGLETDGPPVAVGPGNSVAGSAAPSTKPAAGKTPAPKPAVTAKPSPGPAGPTPKPTPKPVVTKPLSACPIFPSNNAWNKRVDSLPVASNSATMIAAIGVGSHLHPDFSNGGNYGIPFNLVNSATPRSTVTFKWPGESDKVGYPIPSSPKIEGGSDRHLLMIDTSACKLYELFAATKSGGKWKAGSGAVWNLRSNALRPAGWTSADAAGLPIFPGLVRYEDVSKGAINHALRFTAPDTCAGYIAPARHEAGSGSCNSLPPMGLHVRLKASFSTSGYSGQALILLTALKKYGMILADNGSPWYVTGAPSSHWNDDNLHKLNQVPGSAFEVVNAN
jgi:hypothetical protein